MPKKKVIISAEEANYAKTLAEAFTTKEYTPIVIEPSTDNISAEIRVVKPELVICPAMMTGGGALTLIDNKKANFIFLGQKNRFVEDVIYSSENAIFVETPIEPAALMCIVDKFVMFNHGTSEKDLETRVTKIIHNIGCPAHIKGYHYIRKALTLSIIEPNYLDNITKGLYPDIAKEFGTTPSRVERAIRHAIELVFDRGNTDFIEEMFGYTVSPYRGKPTNSEFIALIADNMRHGIAG